MQGKHAKIVEANGSSTKDVRLTSYSSCPQKIHKNNEKEKETKL